MRKPPKNREIVCAEAEVEERRDPFEALTASVELSRQLNRDVIEECVRALDVRGEDVAFAVVHADEGDVPRIGDGLGSRHAHEQRADQAGRVRDCDEVDVLERD